MPKDKPALNKDLVNIVYTNAQSLLYHNEGTEILVSERYVDILSMTETWFFLRISDSMENATLLDLTIDK